MCSAGLGAKRKAKPPGQKRDIPRSGPPDPPKKKAKLGRPRKNSSPKAQTEINTENSESGVLLRTDLTSVDSILTDELAVSSAISKLVGGADQQDVRQRPGLCQPGSRGLRSAGGVENESHSNSVNATLDPNEICFQQIFTTIEDDGSTEQVCKVLYSTELTRNNVGDLLRG